MVTLPENFIKQIRIQLGAEADAFFRSYEEERTHGLRLNPLKLNGHPSRDQFLSSLKLMFGLSKIEWCPEGYYYEESARPGKHPLHQAGAYYIQEPSAMTSAELLDPQPGDTVLDLAAAPGGKSTQIAGKLSGQGVLVANEIHPQRAKILSENIERMGITNAIVTCAAPDVLAAKFPEMFDKIMLDAPCSGEGMFRKDPDAVDEWSLDHVQMCAARQLDILESAAGMLKPGGTLVYSTCTFNRAENEEVLEAFTSKHQQFSVERTERIWPHLQKGEGHFAALLRKAHSESASVREPSSIDPRTKRINRSSMPREKSVQDAMRLVDVMLRDIAPDFILPPGQPVLFGDNLIWLPASPDLPLQPNDLNGLRTLRPGLHLAQLKKDRAEPAHALAAALKANECRSVADFAAHSQELDAFWRGESVPAPADARGWTLVTAEGISFGWAKASGGELKNHFPKGLRRPK